MTLVSNAHEIGQKLFFVRKKRGLTQVELAELAGLSDRAYADIERGETNMRIETFLRICNVLQVTPDQILTREGEAPKYDFTELMKELRQCSLRDQDTAAKLLSVFLDSLR